MGVVQLKLAARIRAAEPGAGAKTRLKEGMNMPPPGGTPRGSAMGVVQLKLAARIRAAELGLARGPG
jgi:hypothetical protein